MAFLRILAETGPVPGLEEKKRKADSEDLGVTRKQKVGGPTGPWTGKSQDMERLAVAIEKLEENDLLPVVKLILENRTAEMFIKSDVDRILPPLLANVLRLTSTEGEFHFDLYTLGNNVLSQLWDYTRKKVEV